MRILVLSGAMTVLSAGFLAMAPRIEAAVQKTPAVTTVAGRWNLSVTGTDGVAYPSWIEITADGATLTGRICGRVGSAHPLKRIEWDGKRLTLVEEAKIKGADAEKLFVGKVVRGKIAGEIKLGDEPVLKFVATRAPVLKVPANLIGSAAGARCRRHPARCRRCTGALSSTGHSTAGVGRGHSRTASAFRVPSTGARSVRS